MYITSYLQLPVIGTSKIPIDRQMCKLFLDACNRYSISQIDGRVRKTFSSCLYCNWYIIDRQIEKISKLPEAGTSLEDRWVHTFSLAVCSTIGKLFLSAFRQKNRYLNFLSRGIILEIDIQKDRFFFAVCSRCNVDSQIDM